MVSIIFLYGSQKLRILVTRSNPTISSSLIENKYDKTEIVNLNDQNFRIAFSVEGQYDKIARDDPRYVKWYARLSGFSLTTDGDEEFERIIPHRKCTEADY